MDLFSAILLGILQGLTEFLPVSSSGHLVIAQHLLGFKEPELFFDVCLHIGTLLAVLAIFWEDILDLVVGAIRLPFSGGFKKGKRLDPQEKMFILVVVGTIPTVLVGLFARHLLEDLFSSVRAVSINLLITGTFLWLTRYASTHRPKTILRTRWQDALAIGLAQSVAIAPGISRSGATISAGLFMGLDRDWAGKFSFLLFVPAVCGALILEGVHVEVKSIPILPTLCGVTAAAVMGYVALRVLLKLIRKGNFFIFAPYCWLVGGIGLVWSLFFTS